MTISNNPKLKAKLGKANDLEFLLSIKGTSSDPMAVQPQIRFHLKEESGPYGLLFPMERMDGEKVKVTIPGDLPFVQEGKVYTGIVEVNLGNRLFTPTTVNIVFEKEMEVIALPILEDEEQEEQIEEKKIELEEMFSQGQKATNLLDVAFSEKKQRQSLQKPIRHPTATTPNKQKPASAKHESQKQMLKAKFKAMLAD
ncbi:MAG: hypothetical protein E6R04_01855 [Spirochaetes bacterium]|nr:MAG: hypothetical protein E6R04_01855 [Spirochaetota bacterium]